MPCMYLSVYFGPLPSSFVYLPFYLACVVLKKGRKGNPMLEPLYCLLALTSCIYFQSGGLVAETC